jgi:hypothetical protein
LFFCAIHIFSLFLFVFLVGVVWGGGGGGGGVQGRVNFKFLLGECHD